MKISLKLTEQDIRCIIANYVNNEYALDLKPEELNIEVKSKQNYRSEWEFAAIRLQIGIIR